MASFSKKLCRAVEKRKLLYDRNSLARIRRGDVENAWEAVAAECNESVSSVKTRWRNIRKVFFRFVSKSNSAQSRKTRSREYYLYDQLQFLLPHVEKLEPDELTESDFEISSNGSLNVTNKDKTPVPIKDYTDDSNDALSTRSASEHITTPSDKLKRESRAINKSLNALDEPIQSTSGGKKTNDSYVVTEPSVDGSSSLRLRRIREKTVVKLDKKEELEQSSQQDDGQFKPEQDAEQHPVLEEAGDPLKLNAKHGKRGSSKVLRTRSKSLYLERPQYDESSESDADYNPPPRKKPATVKETDTTNTSSSTIVTRKKAAEKVTEPQSTTLPVVDMDVGVGVGVEGEVAVAVAVEGEVGVVVEMAVEESIAKKPLEDKNIVGKPIDPPPSSESTISVNNDTDNDDFAGIDMTLLAAAAEAEANAAIEDEEIVGGAMLPIVVGIDAAVQCQIAMDDEDNEFMERLRKWLQPMSQRQKIVFRRGIYQAYIDAFDDTREFLPQKADKMPLSHGMPAIFTGMTPVEMRLVRHLAMAVTGHKITSTSAAPTTQSDMKSSTMRNYSIQTSNNIHNNSNLNAGNSTKYENSNSPTMSSSRQSSDRGAVLNLEHHHQQQQHQQHQQHHQQQQQRSGGNVGGGTSGVVRTTAIALTNNNVRGANVPRILRKVVRVGNNTNNVGTVGNTTIVNGSSNNTNTHNTILQRNPSLLRPRLVTNSVSGERQRVYRILPSGVVARQTTPSNSTTIGGSSSSVSPTNLNNNNSSNSYNGGFILPNQANHSSPSTIVGRNVTQLRQLLPKSMGVTASSSSSGSNTSGQTTTTIQNISINGEQKLSGISIRRHITPDGRTQISRRYSVCGSASDQAPQTTIRKADCTPVVRRSVTTIQGVPMMKVTEQLKGTTRTTRYTQSPSSSSGGGGATTIRNNSTLLSKFSMHGNNSPNNILNDPLPVAISTWHTTQEPEDIEQDEQQQQQLMQSLSKSPLKKSNTSNEDVADLNDELSNSNDNIGGTVPGDGNANGNSNVVINAMIDNAKNCIITSDGFENFVIKNEPLDLEDED